MGAHQKIARASVTVVAVTLVLVGCTGYGAASQSGDRAVSCSELLDSVVRLSRSDLSSSQLNSEVDLLGDQCRPEYEVFTDYMSSLTTTEVIGVSSCESWTQYIVSDAIALLREDGLCTDDAVVSDSAATWPEGGLGWDVASDYVGTSQRVCGPLRSLRNTEYGAFLNLGVDYPSPERFTFVVWGFELEPIQDGATVCASGSISLYDGVAQVELGSPEAIEIWE